MQIIAITHLPQVASKGDTHLEIYKTVKQGVTKAEIKKLISEDRINHIAKMLSGEKMSKIAVENAKHLLSN